MRELKFAILATGNSVCIEVFQFIDPAPRPRDEEFEFSRVGIFHICVTDPNPGPLVKKIVENGGKKVGGAMDYSRYGLAGQSGVYTQDPWGNVVEVMSISLERVSSAGNALGWYIDTQKDKDKAQGPSL
ncbi:hypothetical protein LTR84_003594 [Exophiala bonariae]|uniref:VOC domain-containing protein n=1 Tax=Exophiala bonariae TaxID=1690606 RepID=A0AAV9N7B5_9EURO|nr:hypothetical protein LTR84_003594 [Exophiala bonariae]